MSSGEQGETRTTCSAGNDKQIHSKELPVPRRRRAATEGWKREPIKVVEEVDRVDVAVTSSASRVLPVST